MSREKNSTEVVKPCEMCMHMCSACISNKLPQFHCISSSFPSTSLFFPSLCLLDEPSVVKFGTTVNKVLLFVLTLLVHFSDCTHSVSADTKYIQEHLFILASYFTLPRTFCCQQTASCHCFLFPDSVIGSHVQHTSLFVAHLLQR